MITYCLNRQANGTGQWLQVDSNAPTIAPQSAAVELAEGCSDRLRGAFGPTDRMEVQVQGLSQSLLIKAESRVK